MTRSTWGSAGQAAALLAGFGIESSSQLNALRAQSELEYDAGTNTTHPLPTRDRLEEIYLAEVGDADATPRSRRDPVLEHYRRTRYLVCPALYALKLPGGRWRYNLDALSELLSSGPPGLVFPSKDCDSLHVSTGLRADDSPGPHGSSSSQGGSTR